MRFRVLASAILAVPLALAALAEPAIGASPAVRGAPFSEAIPANVIILADESGSIHDFKGEREAATEIANAAWSAKSQVAIYGFGSAPPGEPEDDAATKICGLTPVATSHDISTLEGCADRIEQRPSDAQNTDFNAALDVAGQVLSQQATAGQDRAQLIFMLTDGTLDLGNGPATAAAKPQLFGTVLPRLAQQGIEVWPVGFGDANVPTLTKIAGGGAQTIRSCPAGTGGAPKVTAVPPTVTGQRETEQIQQQLLSAFAAASCATAEPGQWQFLSPGKSLTLHVSVNPLTTLGSIVVNKGDPAVGVTYRDPDNGAVSDGASTPAQGKLDGAFYALSSGGAGATQEALRLDDPVSGPWSVTFSNPTRQAQLVGLEVLWQGQVTPDINFSPETGASGQPLLIMVKPALNVQKVSAADVSGLHVAVTVQWKPGEAKVTVPVKFDPASGQFTGTVRVPSGQSDNAQVTATIQAPGVAGAASASLAYKPGGGLAITTSIPAGTRIDPGGDRTFTATYSNLGRSGQPVTRVQFLLANLTGAGNAQISQPPVTIGSGTGTVHVTIHVGHATGQVQGVIEWEVAGTTVQHSAGFLDISVEPPPPWWMQWWPSTILVVLILAGLGLLLRRRHVTDRIKDDARAEELRIAIATDVREVGLAVLRKNTQRSSDFFRLSADHEPKGPSSERWFDVRRATDGSPQLRETTHNGSGLLLLTRTEAGIFQLTAPEVPAPLPAEVAANGSSPGPDQASAVAASAGIRVNRPFEAPPGTGLDDCLFMLTLGDQESCQLPDPGKGGIYDDEGPAVLTERHSSRREEFAIPDRTEYDDFSYLDEPGDADRSGA